VNNGVDLLADMLDPHSSMGDLVSALRTSGIHSIDIDKPASVVIGDELASALHDAGMLEAMPDAAVQIDAGDAVRLQTSLKAMAELGVDDVKSLGAVVVDFGSANIHELSDLLGHFVSDSDPSATKTIFSHGAELDMHFSSADQVQTLQELLQDATNGVADKLAGLGVTSVVAQVMPVVDVIGTTSNNDDPYAFDPHVFPIKH
jgi:hypothetical protein